jgi:hypothetical protein
LTATLPGILRLLTGFALPALLRAALLAPLPGGLILLARLLVLIALLPALARLLVLLTGFALPALLRAALLSTLILVH